MFAFDCKLSFWISQGIVHAAIQTSSSVHLPNDIVYLSKTTVYTLKQHVPLQYGTKELFNGYATVILDDIPQVNSSDNRYELQNTIIAIDLPDAYDDVYVNNLITTDSRFSLESYSLYWTGCNCTFLRGVLVADGLALCTMYSEDMATVILKPADFDSRLSSACKNYIPADIHHGKLVSQASALACYATQGQSSIANTRNYIDHIVIQLHGAIIQISDRKIQPAPFYQCFSYTINVS